MKLLSINIGKERQQQRKDYVETTGFYKMPVNEPVAIKSLGIEGDAICDKKNHGGPDQALYIYPCKRIDTSSRTHTQNGAAGAK